MRESCKVMLPRFFGANEAPPLLALHCSLAHGGAWEPLAQQLPLRRVVAPDLPGHGAQPLWDGKGDMVGLNLAMAEGLAEGLVQSQGGPIDLMGHSFGGVVALMLGLKRPELLRSLTLIEPVLFAAAQAQSPDVFAQTEANFAQMQVAIAAGDDEGAVALFLDEWGMGLPYRVLPKRQRDYARERLPLVLAPNQTLMQDAWGLLAANRLEALRLPVLLVEGDKSPPVVAAINDHLARRLPQVTRLQVAGAGHMLPLTHPAQIAPALITHLEAGARQVV